MSVCLVGFSGRSLSVGIIRSIVTNGTVFSLVLEKLQRAPSLRCVGSRCCAKLPVEAKTQTLAQELGVPQSGVPEVVFIDVYCRIVHECAQAARKFMNF